ncbi:DUF4249 domain-containing protein [Ekhidna sp.]|uniref:DUF4249 domain-containing protein n=1 Tax=Ekhidna sp. TaxID=2608089 RepID=UPI003CCC08F0
MKKLVYISLLLALACEEVVIVDLPQPQNLVVIEGWVTDSLSNHPIRITRSGSFASQNPVPPIEDAQVLVQARTGEVFQYTYHENGFYRANNAYRGITGNEYRVLAIVDTFEIRSDWDMIPEKVQIQSIQVQSFLENDPNNPGQQITVYYPKVNVVDPVDSENYYRWIFYKNDVIYTEPDPITVQNDRLFNGNLIPNNFRAFGYDPGDEITIQLQSISPQGHRYLALLRSQITTLGTSSGTTPAIVDGNLFYVEDDEKRVLGYFGAAAISADSVEIR